MAENSDKVNILTQISLDKIVQLIKDYVGDYNKQEHPFLLFDLAHINENDHTKVLLGILKFNNYMFLPSFLQAIGAPVYHNIKVPPTDQKPAIGNSGTGFIDLYFEYLSQKDDTVKVIIENKIYGAGDTTYQLARYIATVIDSDIDNTTFEKDIWTQWRQNKDAQLSKEPDYSKIHVVYLTSDGTKKPDITSLPVFFRKNEDKDDEDGNFEGSHINYYPINYLENIIPWLENDVLPNMPYLDDGIAIAGVRQYLASLKVMFSNKGNSKVINEFVEVLGGNNISDTEKYKKILSVMDDLRKLSDNKEPEETKELLKRKELLKHIEEEGINVNDLQLQPMLRDLRNAATSIFSNDGSDMGGDWKLYFTPSFIFLYRQKWADLDTRKYSIPSIYFRASPKDFINNKTRWRLQVDHLKPAQTKPYFLIPINELEVDIDDAKSRKEYYKKLIDEKAIKEWIEKVDGIVENIQHNPSDEPFQNVILEELKKSQVK
jgi:hypothetical protein